MDVILRRRVEDGPGPLGWQSHYEEFRGADRARIEDAVLALDGRTYNEVSIEFGARTGDGTGAFRGLLLAGGDAGCVSVHHLEERADGLAYHSLVQPDRGDSPETYNAGGQDVQRPARYLVHTALALRAVASFLDGAGRDPALVWELDVVER